MKKFLLMSCAALATLTINAADLTNVVPAAKVNAQQSLVFKSVEHKPMTSINGLKVQTKAIKPFTMKAAAQPAKAASLPYTTYICASSNLDEYVYNCDSVSVSPVTVQDAEGNTYNVALNFGRSYVECVYGVYDEDAQTLTIPSGQICYTDDTYGEMYIAGVTLSEDQTQFTIEDALTFDVDPTDGTLTQQEDGYVVAMTGDNEGSLWIYGIGNTFLPANGQFTYALSGSNGWGTYTSACAVVDNGASIDIYNAFDLNGAMWSNRKGFGTVVSVDYDETEGTCSLAMGQKLFNIYDIYGSTWDSYSETYGDYFSLVGCALDGNTITTDPSVTELTGTYQTMDGLSEVAITSDTDYYRAASDADEDGGRYGLWLFGLVCDWGSQVVAGVDGVTVNKPATANSNIYNLNGQLVGKDYKGLVIKNGKKMILK